MAMTTAPKAHPTQPQRHPHGNHAPENRVQGGLIDPAMLAKSLPEAVRKFDPRTLWRNPVMFIVEIGALWSVG
jgi:K+-transporting ATPase ATPase B chain